MVSIARSQRARQRKDEKTSEPLMKRRPTLRPKKIQGPSPRLKPIGRNMMLFLFRVDLLAFESPYFEYARPFIPCWCRCEPANFGNSWIWSAFQTRTRNWYINISRIWQLVLIVKDTCIEKGGRSNRPGLAVDWSQFDASLASDLVNLKCNDISRLRSLDWSMGHTRAIIIVLFIDASPRVVVCSKASGVLEWVDHAGTPRI